MKTISWNIALYPSASVSKKAIATSRGLKKLGSEFVLDGKNYYPHITLYMTEFPVKNLLQVRHALREVVKQHEPFHLSSGAYGSALDGYIFVNFRKTTKLMALHNDILRTLNPLREGYMRERDRLRLNAFGAVGKKNLTRYGALNAFFQLFPPHLTLTKLHEANPTAPHTIAKMDFSFTVREIGLFQSGTYGTCRKLIERFRVG